MMKVFEEGMACAEMTFTKEEILKDGKAISKSLKENDAYEICEDLLTDTYKVRVGNHVMSLEDLKGERKCHI